VATKAFSEAEAEAKAARLVLLVRVGILRVEDMASVIGCYKAEGKTISQNLYFQQESNHEKLNTTNVESQESVNAAESWLG
jgi:hypothetical protein